MVLCFAMCATLAFAQKPHPVRNKPVKLGNSNEMKMIVADKQNADMSDFASSLFTKADTLGYFDFSMAPGASNANYTTGTLTARDLIDNQAAIPHGQAAVYAIWQHWSSLDSAALMAEGLGTVYPTDAQYIVSPTSGWSARVRLDSVRTNNTCTGYNGWMYLNYDEQPTMGSGAFHTYIKLNPVDATAYPLITIRFFQCYINFYDECFVDYSTDNGTTWHAMAVNQDGVDVAVNGTLWGTASYTLPAAAAGHNVTLRIRALSEGVRSNAYGYFWFLDDVRVLAAKAQDMDIVNNRFYEGGYQQMPLGMETPLYWYSEVKNTGYEAQTNARFRFDHIYNDASEVVDSVIIGTIASLEDSTYEFSSEKSLVTENAGENYHATYLITDSLAFAYDTIYYNVTNPDNNNNYVWGRDNGVLVLKSAYTFGFSGQYVTDESENFSTAGYSVKVSYTTGEEIPVDENGQPWVIRGAQYVTATKDGRCADVNAFYPVLWRDSVPGDGYIYFKDEDLGQGAYVTNPATDYNDSLDVLASGGYMEEGEYNVINLEFRTQPELRPSTNYRIGYQLAQDGLFAVAASAPYYYYTENAEGTDLQTVYFKEDEFTKKYSTSFATDQERLGNGYDVYLQDPTQDGGTPAGFYNGHYPMIRLLVGPRVNYNKFAFEYHCTYEDDDESLGDVFKSDGETSACGATDSIVEGTETYFFVVPAENCHAVVTIDGTVAAFDDPRVSHMDGYDVYTFTNVAAAHNVNVEFKIGVGIDPVAGHVHMNLQPNPATSQVKLNIEGVTGMVDCALIDMSGRVVYSSKINAETEQAINLENVAKGAYFVRITNDNFTKVERLIVR